MAKKPTVEDGNGVGSKPRFSNDQLQQQVNHLDTLIANAYDAIDTLQNQIGMVKMAIKNGINNSPLNQAQVRKVQMGNQQTAVKVEPSQKQQPEG